jgi:hypothetical protein
MTDQLPLSTMRQAYRKADELAERMFTEASRSDYDSFLKNEYLPVQWMYNDARLKKLEASQALIDTALSEYAAAEKQMTEALDQLQDFAAFFSTAEKWVTAVKGVWSLFQAPAT